MGNIYYRRCSCTCINGKHFDSRKVKTLYVSIAVIFVITLVWLIYGFVAEKTKEKIAVLGALYLMFALCTTVKLEFIIFEILFAALFLLLLYIKKDAYRGIYKYLVYINLLINCVVIPYLSCQGFCYFIYFRAAETTIIATVLLTLLFKYTILSKNPANKENDFFIMTFITDVLAVLFASYQLYDIGIEYNYLFVAVLTVIGIEWILHGFLSEKNTEKIAFLAEMILLASLSWLINPVVYLIIAITLTALFTLMLYLKSEGYSVIYKIAIYIIALINCVVIPVGFIETLEQVEWLGVAGTALIAMFAETMLYKFTTLSKNPQTEESDFIWATFITEVSLCVYAIILMPIFKEAGNWIPATVLALMACVWLIHGFATEALIEKIAVLVEAYVFAFICTSFNPTMYVVITVIIIAVFLFLLYTQENAYSFVFKLCIYVLSMINAFIWPLLFRETLNSLPILVPLNFIFLLLFAVNTLFRFSPLVCNPETDERDMRIITIIVSHVLAVLGIGFTFALKAPEDVFTCAITLILIPIATSWVWTDEDDEPTLLRYIAVGEYVFIPFMLCYALSAPNYVSSIVGIVLAVGCIVLGFAMKMKGVRIYGLVVSMIMIFKLALVDFEKSSLLAYALSFFIAGISCLIISMLYYFVNAAVEKNE